MCVCVYKNNTLASKDFQALLEQSENLTTDFFILSLHFLLIGILCSFAVAQSRDGKLRSLCRVPSPVLWIHAQVMPPFTVLSECVGQIF